MCKRIFLIKTQGETKTSEKFFAKGTKERNITFHLAGRHREEKWSWSTGESSIAGPG